MSAVTPFNMLTAIFKGTVD